MYKFHSGSKHEHDFTSKWYTWPLSYKPVWLHTSKVDESKIETISNVGNIIIWLCGTVSILYLIKSIIEKKDKTSILLLISILSLWVPYVFIKREMFLYHYFPVLPFLFLSVTSFLKHLTDKFKIKYLIPGFLVASTIFFIIYYPIVSGSAIEINKAKKLELFDTWIFTSE